MFRIIEPKVGARAVDHFGHFTPGQAKALRSDGIEGIFVYAEIVSAQDLAAATDAGLWVGFVLEGLAASTRPTASLGAAMASAGIAALRALGVPPGVTVFSDLEGDGRDPADWIAFANAAGDTTAGLGDIPGAYVGEGIGLMSAELYALRVHRYWKAASKIVDRHGQLAEPDCGWCVVQGFPTDFVHAPSGLQLDADVVWEDYARRTITVIASEGLTQAA